MCIVWFGKILKIVNIVLMIVLNIKVIILDNNVYLSFWISFD